jgi:hypothetical protein
VSGVLLARAALSGDLGAWSTNRTVWLTDFARTVPSERMPSNRGGGLGAS